MSIVRVRCLTAERPIYRRGLLTREAGRYVRNRHEPHPDGDELVVAVGATYYTWKLSFMPRVFSATPPTPHELSRSEWGAWLHEARGHAKAGRYVELMALLNSMSENLSARLSRLPGHFAASKTGLALSNRIEVVEALAGFFAERKNLAGWDGAPWPLSA